MLNVKAVFQLLLFFLFKLARCDILVYNIKTQDIEFEFKDVPSKFGDPVPPDGLHGLVVYSKPSNACTPIEKPPAFQNYTGKWIVLIKRYGCQFENKIRNAEEAGYDAAIVHNVGSNALKPMAADTPTGIHIPSVFIGSESGLLIKNNYLYDSGYFILITYDIPFNFTSRLLIIFCVLVGLCLFSVIFFLIVKYFRDRRRRQRHCLPKSCLKKITIHKFKKSDPYEICAICLEEYVENDELRVLPCSHAYHSGCIDPWLIKSRRVCPVCKRMVPTDNSYVSGSDSDTETDDERASLVRNSGNSTNGGTFTRLLVHPFRRPSSDSSSDSISSLSLSTETDSYRSAPETPPQLRRAGTGVLDAGTVPQDYSINSGGPVETTHAPGRPNRQHPIRSHERSRRNVERC